MKSFEQLVYMSNLLHISDLIYILNPEDFYLSIVISAILTGKLVRRLKKKEFKLDCSEEYINLLDY